MSGYRASMHVTLGSFGHILAERDMESQKKHERVGEFPFAVWRNFRESPPSITSPAGIPPVSSMRTDVVVMEADAESRGYDEEQGDGDYDDRTSHTYHAPRVPIPLQAYS